jgi:hypothetical protein
VSPTSYTAIKYEPSQQGLVVKWFCLAVLYTLIEAIQHLAVTASIVGALEVPLSVLNYEAASQKLRNAIERTRAS